MADERVWIPIKGIESVKCVCGCKRQLIALNEGVTAYDYGDTEHPITIVMPDNIRLCRATPDEGIPDEVARTMREIMQRERDSLAWHVNERQQFFAIYKRWPEGDDLLVKIWIDRLARIDNALTWLDQQKGTGDGAANG